LNFFSFKLNFFYVFELFNIFFINIILVYFQTKNTLKNNLYCNWWDSKFRKNSQSWSYLIKKQKQASPNNTSKVLVRANYFQLTSHDTWNYISPKSIKPNSKDYKFIFLTIEYNRIPKSKYLWLLDKNSIWSGGAITQVLRHFYWYWKGAVTGMC
jgi:hypothetical protein